MKRVKPVFIPPTPNLDALRQALVVVCNRLAEDAAQQNFQSPIDANGYPLTNLGYPNLPRDAVTVDFLENRLAQVAAANRGSSAETKALADLHTNRLAASAYTEGTYYYETDRKLLYVVILDSGALRWTYAAGILNLPLLGDPGDLGADDFGLLWNVIDYNHLLRWGGSAWDWGPGEPGSAFIQWFTVAPSGAWWKLADGTGSPVTYLQSDGTTATIALPDLTGNIFVKGMSTYAGATSAAVLPTIAGATASESTHTHTGTVDPDLTYTTIQSGTGANLNVYGHVHTYISNAGSAHSHDIGTIAATSSGAPISIGLLPYFRK